MLPNLSRIILPLSGWRRMSRHRRYLRIGVESAATIRTQIFTMPAALLPVQKAMRIHLQKVRRTEEIAHRLDATGVAEIFSNVKVTDLTGGPYKRRQVSPGRRAPDPDPVRSMPNSPACARSQRMAALQSSNCAGNTASGLRR
jgi:hypothetical protein